MAFYRAAISNKQLEKKEELFTMRVATQADAKSFKKYIKDMDIQKTVKQNEGKPVTRDSLRKLGRMLGGGK
jgi:hypothetical protein